jgi:hypothetical protein
LIAFDGELGHGHSPRRNAEGMEPSGPVRPHADRPQWCRRPRDERRHWYQPPVAGLSDRQHVVTERLDTCPAAYNG